MTDCEAQRPDQWARVEEAFTRQSEAYDSYEDGHPILQWMRGRVHRHVARYMGSSDYVLELNAGTGTDAVHFAAAGARVLATDISEGMVTKLSEKAQRCGLADRITAQVCSFVALDRLGSGGFDYVFSNFGGLNCLSDLSEMTRHLPSLLKKGGFVTLVIMPPLCPWEIALAFRGMWRKAFRRWSRRGAPAHILGVGFRAFYFTPRHVERVLGPRFERVALEGLATFSPPPHKLAFATQWPRVYRFLTWMDEHTAAMAPFRSWADHFILTMRYTGTASRAL